jgi:hypothetical protein
MKLSAKQIDQVQQQTGLDPIPETNPANEQLTGHFGEHTFYVDQNGLYVWELVDAEGENGATTAAAAVQIAAWADEEKTALRPTEPKAVNAIVQIDPEEQEIE